MASPACRRRLSGFQYRQKAGGGYGSWIDIRNSDANTKRHVVSGLTNGTTYTFEVRAVNSSGGGLASNELSAVPSIPPGAPTGLTADGGRQGGEADVDPRGRWRQAHPQVRMRNEGRRRSLPASSNDGMRLDAPANRSARPRRPSPSLTMTHPPITNDTTYTFRVRAVNARENELETPLGVRDGEETETGPTRPPPGPRTGPEPSEPSPSPRPSTASHGPKPARVACHDSRDGRGESEVHGAEHRCCGSTRRWADSTRLATVVFEPTNSSRDVSFTGTPSAHEASATSLSRCSASEADPAPHPSFQRLGGYQRGDPPRHDPRPADGAGGDAGRRGSDAVLGHRRPRPTTTSTGRGGNRVPMGAGRTLRETSSSSRMATA